MASLVSCWVIPPHQTRTLTQRCRKVPSLRKWSRIPSLTERAFRAVLVPTAPPTHTHTHTHTHVHAYTHTSYHHHHHLGMPEKLARLFAFNFDADAYSVDGDDVATAGLMQCRLET